MIKDMVCRRKEKLSSNSGLILLVVVMYAVFDGMCWDSMWKRAESKLRSWELLLLVRNGNGNGNGCSRSNSIVVEFLSVEFVQQLECRQEEEERNRKEMEGVYETHSY